MAAINEFVLGMWDFVLGPLSPLTQYLIVTSMWIVIVMISVVLSVAFTTYFERKVIGYMQGRIGPNRVGPLGLVVVGAAVWKPSHRPQESSPWREERWTPNHRPHSMARRTR